MGCRLLVLRPQVIRHQPIQRLYRAQLHGSTAPDAVVEMRLGQVSIGQPREDRVVARMLVT